jgi:hypothetical protein
MMIMEHEAKERHIANVKSALVELVDEQPNNDIEEVHIPKL